MSWQRENCVYDFFELTTLNMAQQGVFGEILHVEGASIHNLEDYWSSYWNNWRMDYNRNNRGDVYATHGIDVYKRQVYSRLSNGAVPTHRTRPDKIPPQNTDRPDDICLLYTSIIHLQFKPG